MSREAIEEAIEVLEDASAEMLMETGEENYYGEAIAVLRQALEEKREPVAWLSEGGDVSRSKRYMDEMGFKCNPLYTAPPKKEWVGLTLNEAEDFYEKYTDRAELINAVDKFLEGKNHG